MSPSTSTSTPLPTVKPTDRSRSEANNEEDLLLFARFLDGDDAAFMTLFRRHASRLYIYAYKVLGSRTEARDIVQDVWERVIRFRSEKKPMPQSVVGLLVRTTRNLSLNQIRNRGRRREESFDVMGEWNLPVENPHDMTEGEEAVRMALPKLPLAQREILILNAYSGYRYEEIAEMLNEPVGAIRTRAWRARVRLGRIVTAILGLDEDSNDNEGDDVRGIDRPNDNDDGVEQ